MVENNICVKRIPLNMTCAELDKEFSKFGEIKSLKLALNLDHTSRGYGFICFKESS